MNKRSTSSTGSKTRNSPATAKPQKLLSEKEYDNEMRKVAQELQDQGKMPGLDEVMDMFMEALKK